MMYWTKKSMIAASLAGAMALAVVPTQALSAGDKKDDFGKYVTELKEKGLTGEALAKAINEERERRKAIEDAEKEAKKKKEEKSESAPEPKKEDSEKK